MILVRFFLDLAYLVGVLAFILAPFALGFVLDIVAPNMQVAPRLVLEIAAAWGAWGFLVSRWYGRGHL